MLDLDTFLKLPSTAKQLPLDPLPLKIANRMDAIASLNEVRWQTVKAGSREAYLALVDLYEGAGLIHCADWARVQAGEKRIHLEVICRHRRNFIPKGDRQDQIIAIIRSAMPLGASREQLAEKLHICLTTVDNWTRLLRDSGAIVTEGTGRTSTIYKLAHP
jgi:hypothetical protein